MNKLKIGLLGYGNVGSGVVKLLQRKGKFIKAKYGLDLAITAVCDRSIRKKDTRGLGRAILTTNVENLLKNKDIDVLIELIGGIYPAREIVLRALKSGKHVVTANKVLIANHGPELFRQAHISRKQIYFESSVGAGTPVIKTLTEGVAGNEITGILGIINGTCNFILSEMTRSNFSFTQALKEAQKRGFAEPNPKLDISGMDSAHKLAILVYLAFGKLINISDIHVEGITHISHADIEYAEQLGLTIKLLAIAKKVMNSLEVRVHPTLITKNHPLASVNGINNAIDVSADPLGDILLYGQGAGQMSAASGVVSDLVNLATRKETDLLSNIIYKRSKLKLKKIGDIKTKFYIRFMAIDKPGVLSKISGILGKYGISIASLTQQPGSSSSYAVPLVMLTDLTTEKRLRVALDKIYQLTVVKSRPVAIRMEKLR